MCSTWSSFIITVSIVRIYEMDHSPQNVCKLKHSITRLDTIQVRSGSVQSSLTKCEIKSIKLLLLEILRDKASKGSKYLT